MDEMTRRTVTVRGHGTATIVPDEARVGLGVEVVRPTAGEARAVGATLTGAVLAAVRVAGIPPEGIRTSGLSLRPEVEYGPDGTARRIGFRLANRVAVRVPDVDAVAAIVDAAIGAGATDLEGVTFGVVDSRAARTAALVAAIDDARAAATAIVGAVAGSLGAVRLVRELDATDGGSPRPMLARMEAGLADTPVMAGASEIAAVVEVTWDLVDQV